MNFLAEADCDATLAIAMMVERSLANDTHMLSSQWQAFNLARTVPRLAELAWLSDAPDELLASLRAQLVRIAAGLVSGQ